MVRITLSTTEAQIALYVGKKRNRLSLATKFNQRRDPNQSDEEVNVQGVGAEMAVAKWLNVYPDLSPTEGALPDFDLRKGSTRYQVKWNHLEGGDLLIPRLKKELTYFLVVGRLPAFKIVGSLPGISVPKTGEWAHLTYGACWKVHPHSLQPCS